MAPATQLDNHAAVPSEQTLTALRRQRPVIQKLYTFQSRNNDPSNVTKNGVAPLAANEPVVKPNNVPRSGFQGAHPNRPNFYVPPTGMQPTNKINPAISTLPSTGVTSNQEQRNTSIPQTAANTTTVGPPAVASSEAPVYAGSVIGGSGLASFFTSQMSAFKVWLQTTDEKRPPAMQLPILLQVRIFLSNTPLRALCAFDVISFHFATRLVLLVAFMVAN